MRNVAAITAGGARAVTPPTFTGPINFSTKRIWPFGDSITQGTGDGPSDLIGCGYRDRLYNSLVAGGHVGPVFVGSLEIQYNCTTCPKVARDLLHDGHSGSTCVQLNTNLAAYAAATGAFDVCLLMAGTNDLISDNANALTNFNTLFTAIVALNRSAIFFVAQLVPHLIGGAVTTAAFNANVTVQVAAKVAAGVRAYVVDQFDALIPAPSADFTAGNVHPNSQGYDKVAAKWYASMTTLTP